MQKRQAIGDALVQAWLELSSVVWNKRLVSGMTFNEAHVCGLLYHQEQDAPDRPLTATELCKITRLLRSQMNQLIHALESKGYVLRERAEADRRQFYIRLTEAGRMAYIQEHSRSMELVNELGTRLGESKMEQAAALVSEVAQCLKEIIG